jgi:hypothetical protein
MNRSSVCCFAVCAIVAVAAPVRAQVQPLPPSTSTVQLGFDHARGLALVGAFALGKAAAADRAAPVVINSPLVTARADLASQLIGVGLGVQLQQRVSDVVFVREVAVAEPFVVALDGPVVGFRGDALLQLGFDLGAVQLVLGPRAMALAVVDRAVAGRVVLDGVVGVRVPVVEHAAIVASASAGAEQSHRGGALQAGGALTGGLWVGVQLGL